MRVTTPEVTGPAESLADLLAEVGAYRGALAPAVASVGAPSRTRARASAAGTVTDRPVTETALLQKSTGNFAAAVLVALVAARASFLAAWLLGLVRIPDGSEVGCPPSPRAPTGSGLEQREQLSNVGRFAGETKVFKQAGCTREVSDCLACVACGDPGPADGAQRVRVQIVGVGAFARCLGL